MKKVVSIIVMIVLLTGEVCAQAVSPSRDTLPCGQRQRGYFYTLWYDTADWYLRPAANYRGPEWLASSTDINFNKCSFEDSHLEMLLQQYTPRPIRIKGLWAMLSRDRPSYGNCDTNRLPEYLYLYVRDTNVKPPTDGGSETYFLRRIASVRWDTAQPKMMCLPASADGNLYPTLYCHVYAALFDTVYTVSGEFWIGGSCNSNTYDILSDTGRVHWPSIYVDISPLWNFIARDDVGPYHHQCRSSDPDGPWRGYEKAWNYGGPYGAILDEQQWYVEVASADTSQGVGRPTAYYPAGTYQTIRATANSCHRFSHWNDGVTDNPRTIFVTKDTVFTAYFDTATSVYDVSARSNNESIGMAELIEWRHNRAGELLPPGADRYYRPIGSDTSYCEGDSVLFRAKPQPSAFFRYWNDRVTDNPRTVKVTQDTLLTAIFSKNSPLSPCPKVVGLQASVDSGRVRLSWMDTEDGQPAGWEAAWGPVGTPPYLCQTKTCNQTETMIDSLEGGKMYVAYVRSVCGSDSTQYYSGWSKGVWVYIPNKKIYTVTAVADYDERGRVIGGGEYEEGSVATLTADAKAHYRFLQWGDGHTANPRDVMVTQDTTFTAMFTEREGVAVADSLGSAFRLMPNPATGSVVCIVEGDPFPGGTLTMTDASGREVLRRELPPHSSRCNIDLSLFPKGILFVTLATSEGNSTQRLILE